MRAATLLLATAVFGHAAAARAQAQACSPGAPQVVWTIAQKNPDGSFSTFAAQSIGNVIDAAECACDTTDLFLLGRVYRSVNTPITPTVWVGTSCNVITSQPTNCQQVTANVTQANFYSGAGASNAPAQSIPVRALISPMTQQNSMSGTANTCISSASIPNSEFILFPFDPSNPEFCAVQLTAKTSLPAAAQNLVVSSGDGALSLTWDSPPFGTPDLPLFFQVLCADEAGNPIPGQGAYGFNQSVKTAPHQLAYTTCVDPASHKIERRFIAPAATPSGVFPVGDGGVGTGGLGYGVGFGTGALSQAVATPTTEDAGAPPTPPAAIVTLLSTFDQKFVVSDPLQVVAQKNKLRIDGATNGLLYTCVVLAIDNWGNAAPSNYSAATPTPVQNLYRRFLADGGQTQGFCFIATAAYGSYQHPYVRVLRRFRDEALLPYTWGRDFVGWYYRVSPPWAVWIAGRPRARFFVRVVLWPIIGLAWLYLRLTRVHLLLMMIGVAALWRRRRAARALREIEAAERVDAIGRAP